MSMKPFVYSSLLIIFVLGSILFLQNQQWGYESEIDYSQISVIEDVLHQDVLQQDSFVHYTMYQITLYDEYLCGTLDTKQSTMYAPSVIAVVKNFPNYTLQKTEEYQQHIFMKQEHFLFHPDVADDLFVSLNAKNELVLYHADKDVENPQKIFFPLKQEALEEWVPAEQLKRLREGIPIDNVGDYNSVLSTFNEYIIDFPYGYPE